MTKPETLTTNTNQEPLPEAVVDFDSSSSDTPVHNMSLDEIEAQLKAEGENLNPIFLDMCDADSVLLNGLNWVYEQQGIPPSEYIKHSNRLANLPKRSVFSETEHVVIPVSDDNVHAWGESRRHEEGPKLDIDYIVSKGVDPKYALFFRVTQPSNGQPKPEYYWTTDFNEVRGGLRDELGASAETAIILVSTLDTIAQNGGLMWDINDDSGIAVRQIGLDTFDQNKALFSFSRSMKS